MLPTNASDELQKAIGELVHNKVDKLNLERNKISDEGATALAEALKGCPCMSSGCERQKAF